MKFIIKVCDERGIELCAHEQQADPHIAYMSGIVVFKFQSFSLAISRDVFDKLTEEE